MPNDKEHSVGMDVAKDWFAVAILDEKNTLQMANSKSGISKLVKRKKVLTPALIVVEATGGYEEALVPALFEASLPVALVSPSRCDNMREPKDA